MEQWNIPASVWTGLLEEQERDNNCSDERKLQRAEEVHEVDSWRSLSLYEHDVSKIRDKS